MEYLGLCRGALFLQFFSDLAPSHVLISSAHLERVAHATDIHIAGVKVRLVFTA